MKILLLAVTLGCAWAQPPDVSRIMSRVALNQAKSQDLRKSYVYNQKQFLRMVRGGGKVAREERRSLNGATLQFAAKFLDSKDPDEAKVKKLIAELRAPEWSRIVGVKSAEDGENAEAHVRGENKQVTGVAIIAAEATSLTVVNIVGPVDLDSLAGLSGHFSLPKLQVKPGRRMGRLQCVMEYTM